VLYAATQRFSMEFYIRPFLNRWPDETWARLEVWAEDDNYHVRRLVSEGTRPKLPWAKKIEIDPMRPLALLDRLHGDPTRFVTRSVANHLNDISKFAPDAVIGQLDAWHDEGRQASKELDWMTRHALRTLVKDGHQGALKMLGYRADVPVSVQLDTPPSAHIDGVLDLKAQIECAQVLPVMVDYVLHFHRPSGRPGRKVFKLKQAQVTAGSPLVVQKKHKLKGDATTFSLHPGPHRVELQVNGRIVAEAAFELLPAQ